MTNVELNPLTSMIERLIFYSIFFSSILIAFNYLQKESAKESVPNHSGKYILRVNRLYYYLGISGILIALVFVIIPPLVDVFDLTMFVAMTLMLLVFGGLGFKMIRLYRNYYLLFDENVIQVRNAKGEIVTTGWDDLENHSFNAVSGNLILITKSGQKLKILKDLVGLKRFAEELGKRKGWSSKDLKLPFN